MYHRFSCPVCRIYDSRCSVHIPSIFHCTAVQFFRCIQTGSCCLRIVFICGKYPLGNQSCPLNSMARSSSVRFKRIIRSFFIAFQICFPFLCEMLRNSPFIISCPFNYTIHDPARSYTVFFVSCHICRSKKSFYRMHICIDAPIVIQYCKLGIPCITAQSFFFIPEAKIIKFQRFLQQFFRAFCTCQACRGSCEDNKCMCITLLIWYDLAIRSQSCEPSSVFPVFQFSADTANTCFHQLFASGMPKECTNAVYMCHTAGDPCFTVTVSPRCSIISKIVGASARRRKTMAKLKQVFPELY